MSFIKEYVISELHIIECFFLPKLISDEKAIKRYYRKKSKGNMLNLDNPKRFSEKLQWYKLNGKDPLMQICADKNRVRKYISDLGYGYLLNEQYGVFKHVEDIDFDSLPNKFVMKAAHGSGWNIIVKDKNKLNKKKAKMLMRSWLKQDTSWSGREWVYKDMPRSIVIEKYLEDETGELRDYKFFCFNGQPRFMQLEVGRNTAHNTRNFYDMDWKLMPFGKELPHNPNLNVPKPTLFDEMKKIAENLCKPFQFVRVDLYQANGKVYFGELTFFPAGGAPDFVPDQYDEIVGDMWELKR
ncbi:teichuronopeptide biosynthesis TupA-like protein [Faecalimonas umbilicata]|uniref:Glycosyl transferase n=1 Tax=Faecalimonas umbilicata TaxID=1912855 RepID=A0A4R3JU81_9FIRM|nr:ATP-grasp fold amidoligase family protein [Faecalimonas umbilicata]TCS69653.1 teichuronopeptide biosynthesis TupA-like protein [Faecalimonas umbilicata]GBU05931.1 glycosyl transferase [Faecalimonas umbilicata]